MYFTITKHYSKSLGCTFQRRNSSSWQYISIITYSFSILSQTKAKLFTNLNTKAEKRKKKSNMTKLDQKYHSVSTKDTFSLVIKENTFCKPPQEKAVKENVLAQRCFAICNANMPKAKCKLCHSVTRDRRE